METAAPPKPLNEVVDGRKAIVKEIRGGRNIVTRMVTLGVIPGTEIEMVRNPKHGPLIIKVKGSYIALGQVEAAKILVQEEENAGMPRFS
ncbi:MAG: ferrous iron transport protein A [Anaerolineae bacterium]|nr:ferrous iron transport protein A [Anaerolineae bacterium]MDW8101988.1 ferrous iron transport protein A [Anaerolineae bacterium]